MTRPIAALPRIPNSTEISPDSFSKIEKKTALVCKYARELINHADTNNLLTLEDFRFQLENLDLETIQPLYFALRNLFTPQIGNEHRLRITVCFRNTSPSEWTDLVSQISFIMPKGTKGHDVMWATEILTLIPSPQKRKELIHIANRLFKYDTLTVERGYILASLLKKTEKELQQLDTSNEAMRDAFVSKVVPPELKAGARIGWIYDPVQDKGWSV